MRRINCIFVFSLVFVLSAASLGWAFGEIRYPDRPLNLRNGRSARATWVGSLYPGQKVRVAYLKNGWVAIFEPGATDSRESAAVGYSNSKYLKKKRTRHEPKAWGELVYTKQTLNVRSKPALSGRKLDTLKAYEHVRVDYPDDDWIMVFWPSATIRSKLNARGYCSDKYFKPATEKSVRYWRKLNGEDVSPSSETVAVKSVKTPADGAASQSSAVSAKSVKKETVAPAPVKTVEKTTPPVVSTPVKTQPQVAKKPLPESPKPVASPSVSTQKKAAEPTAQSGFGKKKTLVIDRTKFAGAKRPDPTPDKTAHGYQYRIVEKSETKRLGESWITVKVFLATKKLPGTNALKDFSTSIWKEYRRPNKFVSVLIYVPGMDLEDLAYGVSKFNDQKMIEFWVRKATLFGTEFL